MGTIGIEWVNAYHGLANDLKNNDDNARGFYNTLTGVKRFDYGDDLAWDQDFEQGGIGTPSSGTDSSYADNVDIVYFSGHGNIGGPMFGVAGHDDGWAKPSELRLGNLECEWAVFDACEVLQESQDVFGRLGPAFAGLHYMLGFHTICTDVGDRGRKFAERLNAGWTVRDAWMRACTETEDSDKQWAYLRAATEAMDTLHDHWWGRGSVSGDPTGSKMMAYMRGSC